jgi:hypothetical protein
MNDSPRLLNEELKDSEFRKIRNELYLSMLDRSMSEAEEGNIIVKTIDDLEEYERSQV